MKRLAFSLLALALGLTAAPDAAAQTVQLTPRTLAAAGARGVGTTVALTYTLGQPFAASLTNAGATFRLTQGFQQPTLSGAAARPAPTVQPTRAASGLTLDAWPNPTADYLHLTVQGGLAAETGSSAPDLLTATLSDALGRPVLTQPVRPAAGLTALDLRALPPGAYLLQLTDATGHRRATARVVRQ